jgi:hypothetical protein
MSGSDLLATGTIVQRRRSIIVCDVADTGDQAIARALVTYKLTCRNAGA